MFTYYFWFNTIVQKTEQHHEGSERQCECSSLSRDNNATSPRPSNYIYMDYPCGASNCWHGFSWFLRRRYPFRLEFPDDNFNHERLNFVSFPFHSISLIQNH